MSSKKLQGYFISLLGLAAFAYAMYTIWHIVSGIFRWAFGWLFQHPEQPIWIMILALLAEIIAILIILALLGFALKLIGHIVRSTQKHKV